MRFVTAKLAMLASTLAIASGCGQSATDPPAATAAHPASAGAAADSLLPSNPIARVTYDFLDAIRRGDNAAANALLTPLALQRTTELDLNFSPPGSPTATFAVGEVELVEEDKAVVQCRWADRDADGNLNEEQILWALRLADGQWRISGMAAEIGPDQPDVVIDFENPEAFLETPVPAATTAGNEGDAGNAAPPQTAQDPFNQSLQR